MLKVKRLDPRAILPTVSHPGEDLAYDVYAMEDVRIYPGHPVKVRTGIAAAFDLSHVRKDGPKYGLLIRDRSSMAEKGYYVTGGVVDAGYRGEILVVMNVKSAPGLGAKEIKAGDKIAQMIPIPALTGKGVQEVDSFEEKTYRGEKGFGSSGGNVQTTRFPQEQTKTEVKFDDQAQTEAK